MAILLLLLLTIGKPLEITGYTPIPVDRIDINHVYDSEGKNTLTQLILWRWGYWKEGVCGYRVANWKAESIHSSIEWQRRGGRVEVRWRDGESHFLAITNVFRETHTAYDVELKDRQLLPEEDRRSYLPKPPLWSELNVADR